MGDRFPTYTTPDDEDDEFMRMLLQAELVNVARLHGAAMKAGYRVNGRDSIHPIGFTMEILGRYPALTSEPKP